MKARILIVLFCLTHIACQNTSKEQKIVFDANQWQMKVDSEYPYRDRMIDDLISSNLLKSLNRQQILEMLGAPDRIDNDYLFYLVEQQRAILYIAHQKHGR
jgi:hypothetical protein